MENYRLEEIRQYQKEKNNYYNRYKDPMKKEPYFVFLDIDGTLWDAKYASSVYGEYTDLSSLSYPPLKKSSIEAVNLLLSSLEKQFDTFLVISSQRRKDMSDCVCYLKEYGLSYSKPIFAIKYPSTLSRGENILDFMKTQGEKPFERTSLKEKLSRIFFNLHNGNFKNYVVLEDEKHLIIGSIPKSRIILSDHDKRSITKKQVENFLKRNDIPTYSPAKINERQ